jgi:hypothetical protein
MMPVIRIRFHGFFDKITNASRSQEEKVPEL